MATLYTEADSNIRKTWLYISFFLVLVISVGYFISYFYNSPTILIFAVVLSTGMSVTSYWYSDKIVLGIGGAKEVSKSEAPELYRIVENIAITAGLPTPKVYITNDSAPNAFATGRNPEHSVVAVTRGLLEKLDKTELEGVIAHEMSHVGNRDTLLQTVIVVLVGIIALLADMSRRSMFFGRHSDDDNKAGALIFIIGLILMILAPIFAQLMQFAISRKREFLADADGALLTRYPEGLAKALEKIASDPTPLAHANRATAHLYIANPLKSEYVKVSKLFSTHPPIAERIAKLRGMEIK